MDLIVTTPEKLTELIETAVQQALATVQPAAETDELGGIDLACRVTGLSESTIYRMVKDREIPNSKRANRLYFLKSQLVDWAMSGSRTLKA